MSWEKRFETFIDSLDDRMEEIRYGEIVIEVRDGIPVRYSERKSKKFDNERDWE